MRSRPPAAFYRNLSNDWIYYSALVCIVVLGLFVRIHQIGADDLWIDEAFTGLLALTPEWISYLRTDNTPPLYYLVMKLWCSAVTCGEVGLRLPSALAGTLFIALVGWFFRHAFGAGPPC